MVTAIWTTAIGGLALMLLGIMIMKARRIEQEFVTRLGLRIGMLGVIAFLLGALANIFQSIQDSRWDTAAICSCVVLYATVYLLRARATLLQVRESRRAGRLRGLAWLLPKSQREVLIGDILESAEAMRAAGSNVWYIRLCMLSQFVLSACDTWLGRLTGWIVALFIALWKIIT